MLVHSKEFMSKKTVGAVNKARTENWLILVDIYKGAGIAQLAERPTEKPGAILTRVRVPGAARDLSPRVNFYCRLSYGFHTVCSQCPCAR